MIKRLELSEELHKLFKDHNIPDNIYYQPPSTVMMDYPCVRYKREDIDSEYADNIKYMKKDKYILTVIDPDPDSLIPDILLNHFNYISFNTQYSADNLNHFVLTLFY